MAETFLTGNGWGSDAKLKSPPIRDRDRGHDAIFAKLQEGGYVENTDKIFTAYFDWLSYAGEELELKASRPPKPNTPSAKEIADRLGKPQ
jgi:hypothetical protein